MPFSISRQQPDAQQIRQLSTAIGIGQLVCAARKVTSSFLAGTSGFGLLRKVLVALAITQAAAFGMQLNLTWDDNSNDELGFTIERSTDGLSFTQIATVGPNVTSYVDQNLATGTYMYRVRAYNTSAESIYSNVVNYTEAVPVISTQPVSQSITPGSSVTFSVLATASPSPSYQWLKNGSAISGATNANLTLPNVNSSNAGSYSVMVFNSVGAVTSSAATLTVTAPPTAAIAPAFSAHPSSQTITAGAGVTFTASASGYPSPTYQWYRNGVAVSGATNDSLTLSSVSFADAGTYRIVATNSAGSATSNVAILTIPGANTAPTIATDPSSQSAASGANVTFSVLANGSPAPSYQWTKDGSAISGANTSALALSNVTSANAGGYAVVVSNAAGSVTSALAVLTVSTVEPNVAPTFYFQPYSQEVSTGANVSFLVNATGTPAPTYQWYCNGAAIAGATSSTLSLSNVTTANAGNYTVTATNSAGSVTSTAAVLSVATPVPAPASSSSNASPIVSDNSASRMVNVSIRAIAGQGSQTLIVGFVVAQGNKSVMLRAIGPGLAPYTTAQTLQDPTLTVYSGPTAILSNDNWNGSNELRTMFSRLGAFALSDSSKDSALAANLQPNAYTAQISGTSTGMALAEIYDTDLSDDSGRLINIAARAQVGTGDNVLIAGFVISGTKPKQLLIRAVGPSLSTLGVSDSLSTPQLDLYSGSTLVKHNEGWGGSAELSTIFSQVGAFPLSNSASKDAVLLVTLEPGAYTAIVSGTASSQGVALVEVYEVP